MVIDEDGIITLPHDLLSKFGWTTEVPPRWSDEEDNVLLGSSAPGVLMSRS